MGNDSTVSIARLKTMGVLSALIFIIGVIDFPGHGVLQVIALLLLMIAYKELNLNGHYQDIKTALSLMIGILVFNYVVAGIIYALYGPLKVTINSLGVVTMYVTPSMPIWLRYPSNQIAFTYAVLVATWPFEILIAYYIYRSFSNLGNKVLRYAGLLMLIGAVLYVVLVGAIFMILSYVLMLIGWLTLRGEVKDHVHAKLHVTRILRLIAWSLMISLLTLVTLSSILNVNPQYYGLNIAMLTLFASKHPVFFTTSLMNPRYTMISIGLINSSNTITILGYIMAVPKPYYIKVSINMGNCLEILAVEPGSTRKIMYTIPGLPMYYQLNPFAQQQEAAFQGSSVMMSMKGDEVSWIYTPAMSHSSNYQVLNGFLLTCLVNGANYVLPANITIMAISKIHKTYFLETYTMNYTKLRFMINSTAIILVNNVNGSFTKSTINYVNLLLTIYLPVFICYVIYDRRFYGDLLRHLADRISNRTI
ncbi:hypothetical protein VMUT_1975 [Vulcanisaeta moutnovskia 768-28]|uniref:Uncharacterized protein n=1 Tax=Vulcanisaeta moutnovskia (strain 768-28) TaxID=985053 RepID=F0QW81_VULM7|nr:DUF996 domain-containing protein [Vulcanisaeta moutnovskia]ADY02176.1 hypothetical protein VMUT_1975 [Vulcanisaeta moutnovskia 768-28]